MMLLSLRFRSRQQLVDMVVEQIDENGDNSISLTELEEFLFARHEDGR